MSGATIKGDSCHLGGGGGCAVGGVGAALVAVHDVGHARAGGVVAEQVVVQTLGGVETELGAAAIDGRKGWDGKRVRVGVMVV